LLTWAEAAVALGMSVRTLQRLKSDKAIGSTKLAGKIYFSWDDITAYVESQHTEATVKAGPVRGQESA
jgi:excisionase family DNA binding protein